MVAYLQKSEGSEGFHQIIDFLNASHIQYALTKNPTIYVSFIKQFWRTATARTSANGEVKLTATIDGQVKTITEASLRRHLKLEDNGGVTTLPNSEIFEQLALMGYVTDSDKLTFQKGHFSPQWKFLIHTILHCLSPKKTAWEHTPSTSQPPNTQPTPDAEEAVPMPHESPLHSVHSLRREYGSLSLSELTVLCTNLSNKVQSLETELKETKQTYKSALTQLIRSVKKLEQIGRSLIEELGMDAGISLVPLHAADDGRNDDTQIYDQPAEQLGVFSAATALADALKERMLKQLKLYTEEEDMLVLAVVRVSTASRTVSTASELGSTTGVKAKDKGKAIMQESEPPKKVKKRCNVEEFGLKEF
ncbi:hypothetical protein Tco_0950819 [Tanacetum coccineum]